MCVCSALLQLHASNLEHLSHCLPVVGHVDCERSPHYQFFYENIYCLPKGRDAAHLSQSG